MFDIIPFKRNTGIKSFFEDFEKDFVSNFFNESLITPELSSFKTDIKETAENYLIEADLPGFNKEDINISINDKMLTISARKDHIIDESKDNFIRKERRFGQLSRSFSIDNVDENKINASYKNGVLELVLPKLSQEQKPRVRKIDIM